jgi:hypothetical protein
MKLLKTVLIATLLILLPAYAFSSNLGYMRISLMEGDVQIKTQETGDWGLASINAPVEEGDQLWVPEGGRLELQLNTGTYIRLDQDSAVEILSMDKSSSQFHLSQGHAYVYYNAPEGSIIQVDTPDASTRVFEKALFRIDISDQYTDIAVYSGNVETENRIGTTRINQYEMLSLSQDTSAEVTPMGPPDEWETWNKARNDTIFEKRGVGNRYLPSELREYSYDFDSYGKWVDVPEYGHCWIPTAAGGANWAPYREGRWVWMRGDYVWVAYEPWGWAPYHYGRWVFASNAGWCWVPPATGAVYWGPGYVGWVRTEDYVAWVPLAPGEIYYGRGYYGPHSRNIINININQVRITTVYKNVHIHNGVTIVNRQTFATANPKMVHLNENIIRQKVFVRNNISVGTPAIKPSKASYFMSSRPVPQTKLPPHHIRSLQVKELKQSRPFMREHNQSVWNPGEKPKPLPVKTITMPKIRGKGRPMIQPVQPVSREKIGEPGNGPVPKEERHIISPEKKFVPQGHPLPKEDRRIAPPEKKLAPQVHPFPKEDRRIAPLEKKLVPQASPAPKGEKHIIPHENRSAPEKRQEPSEEQRIKPVEKKSSPEAHSATKEEKKHKGPKKNEKKNTEEPERLN